MGGLRKDYWERMWKAPSLGWKDGWDLEKLGCRQNTVEKCESRESLGKLGM